MEVVGVLVFKVVHVFAEELGSFFKNTWHLFGCCVNQNHFGNIDDVCLVRLFGQVPLVDIQCFQVDATNQFTVTLAQLLDQAEYLLSVFLVFKLLQVVEQFVEDLGEKGSLTHSGLTKEQINFFTQSRIVLV